MATRVLFAVVARQLCRPNHSYRIAPAGAPDYTRRLIQAWPASAGALVLQHRAYGSSKKGAKRGKGGAKKGAEADEDCSPVEMTLDVDKMADHMEHSVGRFAAELQAVRAGRASPAILNGVRVVLKGGSALLPDLAMIAVKDAQNLIVIPNSADTQRPIESSIRSAGLGLNPRMEKDVIIVPVPKSTKESREKLLKSLGAMAESARVHVRKHRQDAMKRLKADSRNSMTPDEVKAWEKDIQATTEKFTGRIEDQLKAKQREIERT
ncbi:hypothetical protein GGI20_001212 [Coemansia sp. BCRC 34301]|nr:hypothetical protein GGI20_001212 [Coemansia sp. BCRC 34301]